MATLGVGLLKLLATLIQVSRPETLRLYGTEFLKTKNLGLNLGPIFRLHHKNENFHFTKQGDLFHGLYLPIEFTNQLQVNHCLEQLHSPVPFFQQKK